MTVEVLQKEKEKMQLKDFSIMEHNERSYCLNKTDDGKYITYTSLSDNEMHDVCEYDTEAEACKSFFEKMKCVFELRYGGKKKK